MPEKRLAKTRAAYKVPAGCYHSPGTNRVCERGTLGCIVKHAPKVEDRNNDNPTTD